MGKYSLFCTRVCMIVHGYLSGGDSGEDPDGEKEGKTNEMSGKTRCKVQYRRASTDLYRWGEPDQDVYVRKR
jgi:hypothetical protein